MSMSGERPDKIYIGDGVYARFDGYQIILETSDGLRTTNKIALEKNTMRGLDEYRRYVQDFYENKD